MKKRILAGIAAVALALSATAGLTACNTVEGFGQDVEKAGESIEDASEHGYND